MDFSGTIFPKGLGFDSCTQHHPVPSLLPVIGFLFTLEGSLSHMQKVTLHCDDTTAIQIRRGAHAPESCSSPDVLIQQDCKRILSDGASLRLLLYRLKRLVTHHSGGVSYPTVMQANVAGRKIFRAKKRRCSFGLDAAERTDGKKKRLLKKKPKQLWKAAAGIIDCLADSGFYCFQVALRWASY